MIVLLTPLVAARSVNVFNMPSFYARRHHMHVMLAEDVGPWILTMMYIVVEIAACLLALAAFFPARLGKQALALSLVVPAFVCGVYQTIELAIFYIKYERPDPGSEIGDFLMPWFFLAVPPLMVSVIVGFIIWAWKR